MRVEIQSEGFRLEGAGLEETQQAGHFLAEHVAKKHETRTSRTVQVAMQVFGRRPEQGAQASVSPEAFRP